MVKKGEFYDYCLELWQQWMDGEFEPSSEVAMILELANEIKKLKEK